MSNHKKTTSKITKENEIFIIETHLKLSLNEVSKIIGRTIGEIYYFKRKVGLKYTKEQSLALLNKNHKKILTAQNEIFIRENYLKMSSQDLANIIGCKRSPILTFKYKNNLLVPREISLKFTIDKKRRNEKI